MRVRAKEVCFVDNRLRQVGEEFDFNGPVGSFMEVIQSAQEGDELQPDEDPTPAPAVKRGPGRPRKNPAATN